MLGRKRLLRGVGDQERKRGTLGSAYDPTAEPTLSHEYQSGVVGLAPVLEPSRATELPLGTTQRGSTSIVGRTSTGAPVGETPQPGTFATCESMWPRIATKLAGCK